MSIKQFKSWCIKASDRQLCSHLISVTMYSIFEPSERLKSALRNELISRDREDLIEIANTEAKKRYNEIFCLNDIEIR